MTAVIATPLAPIANKETFIQRVGDWFEGLFEHLESAYDQLEDLAKKAAVWGSGVIAVVNANLTANATVVEAALKLAFPDLDLSTVQGFLDNLKNQLDAANTSIPLTFEAAIQWLQGYLSTHKATGDGVWGTISSAASNLLSIMFSPETAIEKFINVGVYVYQMIVKPHVATVAAAAAAPAETETAEVNPDGTPVQTMVVGSDEWNAAVDAEVQKRLAAQAAPPVQTATQTEAEAQAAAQAAEGAGIAGSQGTDQSAALTDGAQA